MDDSEGRDAVSRRTFLGAGGTATALAAAAGTAAARGQHRQGAVDEPPMATTPDEGGDQTPTEPTAGDQTAAYTLIGMLGLGFLSPIAFALLLRWRRAG